MFAAASKSRTDRDVKPQLSETDTEGGITVVEGSLKQSTKGTADNGVSDTPLIPLKLGLKGDDLDRDSVNDDTEEIVVKQKIDFELSTSHSETPEPETVAVRRRRKRNSFDDDDEDHVPAKRVSLRKRAALKKTSGTNGKKGKAKGEIVIQISIQNYSSCLLEV